jgi:hypothetical protein
VGFFMRTVVVRVCNIMHGGSLSQSCGGEAMVCAAEVESADRCGWRESGAGEICGWERLSCADFVCMSTRTGI